MQRENAHPSDEKLILVADGEIHGREEADIREHLAACPPCMRRMRELEDAIAEIARMHRDCPEALPPAEGPRALLKARLRELTGPARPVERHRSGPLIRNAASCAAAFALLAVLWFVTWGNDRHAIPRAELTPGAIRNVVASDICSSRLSGNAQVVPAIQRQVFAEYGMPNAESKAYEVDYLITPALGGSDDIRNLWPQPYSGSSWNAYVKDALEDRMRRMVCTGELDLATAQHEIASNWIVAYKKYFHTSRPLVAHLRPRTEEE